MLISFSGLDGSGKSTLIEWLKVTMKEKNYPVTALTMYYDLSFYALIRAMRDRVKKWVGIKEVRRENPENRSAVLTDPILRKKRSKANLRDPKIGTSDKKRTISRIIYGIVRSVTAKQLTLFLDLIILSVVRFYVEFIKKRILITDRYLYDSLADVADLENRKWGFIRIFLLITPVPQLPIFVDVTPEEAYARKGEYPVHYMKWRRGIYLKIFGWVDDAVIIVNDDLDTTKRVLETVVVERLNKR